MMDLMAVLCLTPKESLLCADLIFEIGSDYMNPDKVVQIAELGIKWPVK